jgi:hypothetical protein
MHNLFQKKLKEETSNQTCLFWNYDFVFTFLIKYEAEVKINEKNLNPLKSSQVS